MRNALVIPITFLVTFSALVLSVPRAHAQAADTEQVGKSPVAAKFISGGRVRLSLCPGAIEVTGRDDNQLRVSYTTRANEEKEVRVRIMVNGDQAAIRVSGCPHNNFELRIEVPKTSNLYARMFAGEMSIGGIRGDKDVEMHAGHLTLEIGRPDENGHVDASVLTGDLEASAFDVSKGGLFRSFDHRGPGKFRVHAHVGAGQLELR
jgi:hypothetical protein